MPFVFVTRAFVTMRCCFSWLGLCALYGHILVICDSSFRFDRCLLSSSVTRAFGSELQRCLRSSLRVCVCTEMLLTFVSAALFFAQKCWSNSWQGHLSLRGNFVDISFLATAPASTWWNSWLQISLHMEILLLFWLEFFSLYGNALLTCDCSFALYLDMLLWSLTWNFVSTRKCCSHSWLNDLCLFSNPVLLLDESIYFHTELFLTTVTWAFVSARKCCCDLWQQLLSQCGNALHLLTSFVCRGGPISFPHAVRVLVRGECWDSCYCCRGLCQALGHGKIARQWCAYRATWVCKRQNKYMRARS